MVDTWIRNTGMKDHVRRYTVHTTHSSLTHPRRVDMMVCMCVEFDIEDLWGGTFSKLCRLATESFKRLEENWSTADTHREFETPSQGCVDARQTQSFEHFEGTAGHPPSPSSTWKETRPTLCRRSIDGVLRALRRNLVDGRTPTHSFEDFDGNSPNVVSTPHGPSPSSTSKEPGRPPTPTQSFGDLEGNSPNVVSTFDRRSPSSTSKEPGRRPDTHPFLRALRWKLAQRCVDAPWTESFEHFEGTWSTADTHPVLRGLRRKLAQRCVDVRSTESFEHFEGTWSTAGHPPCPSSTWKETRPALCRRSIDRVFFEHFEGTWSTADTHPVLRGLRRKLAQRCVDVRSTESFEHFEGTWSTAGHPPCPSSTWKETRPALCRRSIDRVFFEHFEGTWSTADTHPVLRGLRRKLAQRCVDVRSTEFSSSTSKEPGRPPTPTQSFGDFEGNSPNVVSTFDRRSPSNTSKEPGRRPDTHPVLRALGRKLAQRCVDAQWT